jgi:transposase
MIRMLIVGHCFGIRSERGLCEEVDLNLAYRWFCRLGRDGDVPIIPSSRKIGMAVSARGICREDNEDNERGSKGLIEND